MQHFLKALFTLILIAVSSNAVAKSPVFKVSKGDDHLFIGGTIHLLSEQDYPLPSAFDKSYKNSDSIIFETDIAAAQSPEMQMKILPIMMNPTGTSLKSQISDESYQLLTSYLTEQKLPIETFDMLTPIGVSLTLLAIELQKRGITGANGVESFYNLRGKNDSKEFEQLESIDEQVSFIKKMGEGDPDMIIKSSISEMKNLNKMWDSMVSAWKQGNFKELEAIGITPMLKDFPEMYQYLLVDRNNRWMKKIKPMFGDQDIEFIMVGALHLVGEDGLIEQLKELGYKVEQLD